MPRTEKDAPCISIFGHYDTHEFDGSMCRRCGECSDCRVTHDGPCPLDDAERHRAARDCNGYALGSSCSCNSADECPSSRVIPSAEDDQP